MEDVVRLLIRAVAAERRQAGELYREAFERCVARLGTEGLARTYGQRALRGLVLSLEQQAREYQRAAEAAELWEPESARADAASAAFYRREIDRFCERWKGATGANPFCWKRTA
ncbi:MAG TPA: hypothetical protein VJB16_02045 [archaeon]|nr:hypothetical protein [archaeon]